MLLYYRAPWPVFLWEQNALGNPDGYRSPPWSSQSGYSVGDLYPILVQRQKSIDHWVAVTDDPTGMQWRWTYAPTGKGINVVLSFFTYAANGFQNPGKLTATNQQCAAYARDELTRAIAAATAAHKKGPPR